MFKLILICLVAAVIEAFQMITIKKSYFEGKGDPNAISCTAHKVHEPSFNYIPGRQTFDDKSGRYVIDWKYEWEYKGKKHSIMFCNNPNSQYEHYMAAFPENITLTIHKETGKYYVPKNVRAQGNKYLLSLAISLIVGYVVVSLFI